MPTDLPSSAPAGSPPPESIEDMASGIALAHELTETSAWMFRHHAKVEPHLSRVQRAIDWLRGSRTSRPLDVRWVLLNDPFAARIQQCAYVEAEREIEARYESQLSALREENERLTKQIAILEAPDICGRNEDTFYEQDDFDGLAEIPNEIVGVDWANRVIDGEWRAVNLVTAWNEDGDADEWEIRLFRSDADAKAAIAESLAKRAAISSPPLDRERSNGA